MKLETERLRLRELTILDAKEIASYTNNPDFCKYIPPIKLPYMIKDAKDYLKVIIKNNKQKNRKNFVLGIGIKSIRIIIGIIEITYDDFNNTAQLDYSLNPKYHRQGIMFEASVAMIDFAFNNLKVRKITAPILSENIASITLIKKLGFTLEGVLKKQTKVRSSGKIYDENLYGLLKEEWKRKR